jgi:predicted TIM-barrel fold metal-dependent hydrolase
MPTRSVSSRREFLQHLTAATGLAAFSAGCASAPTPLSTSATSLTVIDTHTHFYDPHRPQGVPWPGKDDALLYRTVLPEEYKSLPVPHPVAGTVVVEASPWVEDNQWILNLAARDPFILGLVGNLPAGTPEFARHLARFSRNTRFCGIRIGGSRLRTGVKENLFIDDMKRLADADLALDLLGGPDQLPDAAVLAQRVPNLRIIIDHVSNVRIDGKTPPDEWTRGIREAAAQPKMFC